MGDRELGVAEGLRDAAARVHADHFRLGDALRFVPFANLKVGEDRGARPPGDLDRVAEVVAVAVRQQDEIGPYFIRLKRGGGRVVEEWVDEQVYSARFDGPGVVAIPGDLCGHDSSFEWLRLESREVPIVSPRGSQAQVRQLSDPCEGQ